jgi:hypothetical protein
VGEASRQQGASQRGIKAARQQERETTMQWFLARRGEGGWRGEGQ